MDAFGPLNITAEALAEEAGKVQRKLEAGIGTLRDMDEVHFGVTAREEVWRDGKTVLYRFRGDKPPTAKVTATTPHEEVSPHTSGTAIPAPRVIQRLGPLPIVLLTHSVA